MSSSRKPYLDNIRWATVVLVVIYHVIYMFNGVQPFGVIGPFREHQFQDGFLYLVYPWFMALLFVVSCMSARYCLQSHTTKQFLKDKTRKLLVPSTIGLFVFQWILGLYNVKIGGGVDFSAIPKPVLYLIAVLSGVGPLWYIQMLWLFSVLLLAVRKMEKDRFWNFCSKAPVWSIALLVIVVYGSAQVLNTPVVTVYRFGIYGFSFFAGYFLFSHDEVMERLCKWWWMFDLAAAVLGISYTLRYLGENYAVAPVLNNIHACAYCWFAILGILTTMTCPERPGSAGLPARGHRCLCGRVPAECTDQPDPRSALVRSRAAKGERTCSRIISSRSAGQTAFRRTSWPKRSA